MVNWYFAYFFNSFVHLIHRFSLVLGIFIHLILKVFQFVSMSHLPLSRDFRSDHVLCTSQKINLQSCSCLRSYLWVKVHTTNGSENCNLWISAVHENIGSARRGPFSVTLFIFLRHSPVTKVYIHHVKRDKFILVTLVLVVVISVRNAGGGGMTPPPPSLSYSV
jgi:hypothetical protein